MNSQLIETARRRHFERFGAARTVTAYAPGRVEILGNHTDYNEGFVLSAAIDLGICAVVSPSPSKRCVLRALNVNEEFEFDLPVQAPVKQPLWANYVLGVVNRLDAAGKMRAGFQATLMGDIPVGAGLSSSAALETTAALALCAVYSLSLTKLEMAKICQAAEHRFTGAKCGLLDQISSLYGAQNALVFTDFRSLEVQTVPLSADVCFVIANTGVKHMLVESEYNRRRESCEQAAAFFASVLDHPVKALRDVSAAELKRHAGQMDPVTARRAAHIVGENSRVLKGCRLLAAGDFRGFGRLMYQSHRSSRVNFENSCAELDLIVRVTAKTPAVLGARLSGGGFGGSVVLLVRSDDAETIGRVIAGRFQDKFGRPCELRTVKPSAGAGVVAESS